MNRRERKKEKTKDNIIECAVGCFKDKSFNETSMEEIAEKSDVSKGTLYNYFKDKESILAGYFQNIIADYSEEIASNFKEQENVKVRLNKIVDFINQIILKDIELSKIYFRYRFQTFFSNNAFDNDQRSGLENLLLEVIEQAQDNNELRKDISLVIMARNFMLLYMNFFISTIYGDEASELTDFKGVLIELFLNGAKNLGR